ncbi:hypothetical protein [uncultured Xylophilus sp.]|uniref:helix-turn-helix transcriptional regulator n=1 Tax=uncultured Xylophilus sp. TaxID=296832 RepID=UPI0025DF11FB|nr:hypothetical protein [uncultured Xylophilus sp.]
MSKFFFTSDSELNVPTRFTYVGKNSNGKLRFMDGDCRLVGVGLIQRYGKLGLFSKYRHHVPGYVPNAKLDETVLCRGSNGTVWQFVGTLVICKGQAFAPGPMRLLPFEQGPAIDEELSPAALLVPPAVKQVAADNSSTASQPTPVEPVAAPRSDEHDGHARARSAESSARSARCRSVKAPRPLPDWYMHELDRIGAERAAGLDSTVRIEFLIIYLGESRANLYRKMSLVPAQFPQPVKRGRGSFWLMSVIDAYKTGKLGGSHV